MAVRSPVELRGVDGAALGANPLQQVDIADGVERLRRTFDIGQAAADQHPVADVERIHPRLHAGG